MNNELPERPLERRLLLRGGAVLAGAAGVSVIGAALKPATAQAADGAPVLIGEANASATTTDLTIGAAVGSDDAALTLTNIVGPALRLTVVGDGYDGDLKAGEFAFTDDGPDIGVSSDTTFLATGLDLDEIPFTLAVPPVRLVDTRIAEGRTGIRTTSADAFDSSHRLKAGAWADIAITGIDYVGLQAAFVNVVVVKPLHGGFFTVYPPGDRPASSTLNFATDHNVANGAFIAVGIAEEAPDWMVVRVFSTATCHVVVDLTGVTVLGVAGSQTQAAKRGNARQRNAVKSNRMKRVLPRM